MYICAFVPWYDLGYCGYMCGVVHMHVNVLALKIVLLYEHWDRVFNYEVISGKFLLLLRSFYYTS